MNTIAQTLPAPFVSRRTPLDWGFAALVMGVMLWAFQRYGTSMDYYEKGILLCVAPAGVFLGCGGRCAF